jgi:CobQ-like glutamine amidotransferase family enzyme
VCAGYQICGHTFTIGENDEVREGLGLLDVETRRGPVPRRRRDPDALDEAPTARPRRSPASRTTAATPTLGPDATPLARVEVGIGNDGRGTEGALQGNVVATYPHGPVLARNPELADYLLERALGRPLEPLSRAAQEIAGLRRERLAFVRR